MLSYPLAMDIGIFIVLNILHWGSFAGVMVAATSALITSALISIGRKVYGHREGKFYFPGMFDVSKYLVRKL